MRKDTYTDEIKKELLEYVEQNFTTYSSLLEKVASYNYLDYAADEESFEIFKERLKDNYYNKALTDYQSSENMAFKEEIIGIAENQFDDPFRRLIMLRDEIGFNKVFAHASAFLKGSQFLKEHNLLITDQSLFAMVGTYYIPAFKESAIRFFKSALNDIVTYATEHTSINQEPEPETVLSLAQAISTFPADVLEQFSEQLFEIFRYSSDKKRSYPMKQASGFIAIRLTYIQSKVDIQDIDYALKQADPKDAEEIYIQQYLYTKWFLTKNTKAALAHIQKNKNPTFAIFALTDLKFKEALPLFIEKQKVENNTTLWNIYKNAIVRLDTNYWPVNPAATMVCANGNRTPTQLAQGMESDNEYQ